MSLAEVMEHLGVGTPSAARKALQRAGITEKRGYPRDQVEALQRPGRGRRTDLQRDQPDT